MLQPRICIYDNENSKLVTLECKDYIKYLGVLIDKGLNCRQHIDHITVKMNPTVGMIAKLRHFVPRHTLLQICQSLCYVFNEAEMAKKEK